MRVKSRTEGDEIRRGRQHLPTPQAEAVVARETRRSAKNDRSFDMSPAHALVKSSRLPDWCAARIPSDLFDSARLIRDATLLVAIGYAAPNKSLIRPRETQICFGLDVYSVQGHDHTLWGNEHMYLVEKARRHVSVFVSHAAEDHLEAEHYEQVLEAAGFTVHEYGHAVMLGGGIQDQVEKQINECSFFLLIVSPLSQNSKWVQRELGLAASLQKAQKGYRPIIIPIFTESYSEFAQRPTQFNTLDFWSSTPLMPFDLNMRGLNRQLQPVKDADQVLLALMTPKLLVSIDDFDDEATFMETGVFDLYEQLFEAHERDPIVDIMHWVLRADIGKTKSVALVGGGGFKYKLDSKYFILMLANRAIGLAFVTYDYKHKIVFGNYIGVQECWRGGAIATIFVRSIEEYAGKKFPGCRGVVFEVEPYDEQKLLAVIDRGRIDGVSDINEVRKWRRVMWYQNVLRCQFFRHGPHPRSCRSPCLDPEGVPPEDWREEEENYWLMWKGFAGHRSTPEDEDATELWREVVDCVYVEILAKSLVDKLRGREAKTYWDYVRDVLGSNTPAGDEKVVLGRYWNRVIWEGLHRLGISPVI